MDDALTLYHELTDRLRALGTADPVVDLVLAAFRGDETLAAVMRGEPLPAAPTNETTTAEQPQVFLESVEVTGFRGIGPQAALRLKPGPGLTVVAGRNGSAKSSLAEAAEYVLTEDSPRWSQRPAVFREGWRNLHYDGERAITVKLRPGSGGPPVMVRQAWAAGETDLAAATVSVTGNGAMTPSEDLPEWLRSADRFRPFLSARDLERVIASKPTELYDSIAPILGLAPLVAASGRLQALRKEREDRVVAVRAAFNDLRTRLDAMDDPRAAEAVRLLDRQAGRANLPALAALAGGETVGDDARAAAAARRLAEQEMPDTAHALRELAEATTTVQNLASTEMAIGHRVADLLWGALEVHRDLGDQSCPVCGVGVLNASWRESAEQEVERLRAATETVRAATRRQQELHREVEGQLNDVRRMLEPVVAALAAPLPRQTAAVRTALASMAVDEGPWETVTAARDELVAAAAEWLARRHDAWLEPGAAIRRWVEDATVVRAEADKLALLTKARHVLVDVTAADGGNGDSQRHPLLH
ncbi:hypothetical protein AB0J74_21155 [Asanoa sp. NPDC049573]|uniref:hypothetical protein n=1 Tax=Asanoa sp. NPDC049573 TaxID=3155396 RepID=UPI0034403A4D